MNDTIAQESMPGLTRRQFIGAGGGLTLGFVLAAGGLDAHAQATAGTAVNSWLSVTPDNRITLTIGASDMGQGSFQGLAQIMAEDLMVDPLAISLAQGRPTITNPAPVGAAINTVGSSVTRTNYWRLRDAAAIAREVLVSAAMQRLGDSSRSNYTVQGGVITHTPSSQQLSYGDVADAASRITPPASAPLVPDAQLRSIGRALPRQDIPSKTDGSAKYGLDTRLPGMVYAVVRHCPTFGGTLNATPALPSGAIAIVPLTVAAGTGRGAVVAGQVNAFAVVAANTWDAMRAARAASPRWTLPAGSANWNNAQFVADAQALMTSAPAYNAAGANPPGTAYTVEQSTSNADAALAQQGVRVLDATYTLPYVAHACMEVLNCTVDYVAGTGITVHAPTQSARNALALVMQLTGLPESRITIKTTLLGGGLGRKAEQDFIAQAVQVGMALQRPVMLVWPREEDFTHDQYRPMALVKVRAGLDANNQVAGWVYRNVSPSILGQRGVLLPPTGDSQGYEGSSRLPYNFGSRRTEWVSHTAPIPVGFWRSVGASINTFVVESMIDELANAAGQTGYAFRRARLTDPRWLTVLDTVAAASGITATPAAGTAKGIAIGSAFNSIVAMVVEVRGSSTGFSLSRVWLAIDCYLAVNPLNVEAQLVGGVVHAINATLYGQQTFVGGAAQRRNFNTNPMIRMNAMPQVSVTIVTRPAQTDRAVAIGGVGELGVPTFAPALANALFKLTGVRHRSLPLYPNATMGG